MRLNILYLRRFFVYTQDVSFQITQEKFEGPLELLLELIEKEALLISEISLARVTDEYLNYVKNLNGIDPEELAEFLVVAAYLMVIKSRSLLPNLTVNEEEESIEELEKRLQVYKQVKEFAGDLLRLEARKMRIWTNEAYNGIKEGFYPPPDIKASDIEEAFRRLIASVPKPEAISEAKIKKIVSIEERIASIRLSLEGALENTFSKMAGGSQEKIEVIVSFLALLELAKQKFVNLEQHELFEDIRIRKI